MWEVDASKHEPGFVLHTLGWPLDNKTYGGSFLYHMKDRQVSCSSKLFTCIIRDKLFIFSACFCLCISLCGFLGKKKKEGMFLL